MVPIKQYISNDSLPQDPTTAQKVRTTASRYVIIEGELYRTVGEWSLLKCVSSEQGSYILKEMHLGIYGAHVWINAIIRKLIRYEYF